MAWTLCPTLPSHLILLGATFFFVSPDDKSPQRETFANMEDVKQKMAEALKGIKIDEFKIVFEQWESLNRCTASNGKYFESDWNLNILEYTIFYK